MKQFTNTLFLILIYTVTLPLMSGCAADLMPNEFESSYMAISKEIGSPELCFLISPEAFSMAGFAPPGHQIEYTQSECFFNVAVKTGDSALCNKVRTKKRLFLDGSKISKDECKSDIVKRKKLYKGDTPDAVLIMRLLGYNDSDAQSTKSLSNEKSYFILYLNEKDKADFKARLISRLKYFPDFSSSDEDAIRQLHSLNPQCFPDNYNDPFCRRINCDLMRGSNSNPICYQHD